MSSAATPFTESMSGMRTEGALLTPSSDSLTQEMAEIDTCGPLSRPGLRVLSRFASAAALVTLRVWAKFTTFEGPWDVAQAQVIQGLSPFRAFFLTARKRSRN